MILRLQIFFFIFCLSAGLFVSCCNNNGVVNPPVTVTFADTTITAPNGSIIVYGNIWQAPLDSNTLARLRNEGYTGGSDKAPVVGAEVTIAMSDTKLTTTSDRLGRYVLVLKNAGTYILTAKHYATIPNEAFSTDIKSSTQKDITLRPAKEFIFPLAVGNKWVYDFSYSYSSGDIRKGTEQWEIIKKETTNEGSRYTLSYLGQGIEYTASMNQVPYTYKGDTIVTEYPKYYVFPDLLLYRSLNDTIPRFNNLAIDTLKFERGGTSARNRYYVNSVGLIYYYTDGGSPASGRSGGSLKLRSYTLKP